MGRTTGTGRASIGGAPSRADLEERFRDLQKDLRKKVVGRAQPMLATGVAVALAAVVGAYALGRSSGRKARQTRD